jgi:mannitol-1-phosphate/altronate dehydrogenase
VIDSVSLSRSTLARLAPGVEVQSFEVTSVRPGIVHQGLGGFHRAHMARYTHDFMTLRSEGLEWGIVGVGLLAADRLMSTLADLLRERANAGASDPRPLLAINNIFGDLSDHRAFVYTLSRWLGSLYGVGAKATLAAARRELHF